MKPRRVTGGLWLTCSAIHFAGLLIYSILLPSRSAHGPPEGIAVEIFAFVCVLLLLGTPAFAYLWSRLYIGWYNKRYPPAPRCRCGYNLTCNVSGTCPECGTAVE